MNYKIVLSISALLLSSHVFAQLDIDERIAQLRVQYQKELQQKNIIRKLKEEQALIDAYVEIVSARRKCEKLGIDCTTGKEIKSIQEQLIDIDEKKALIKAFVELDRTKEECKRLGIDCKTGQKIPVKKKAVVLASDPKKNPELPTLMGYLDNQVLLANDQGNVLAYQVGDELASGYKVKKIIQDRYTVLEYNGKPYRVY